VKSGRERFIVYGDAFRVVRTGPERGSLLAERHTCRKAPGCDYPYYLIRPDGRIVQQIPGTGSPNDPDQGLNVWLKKKGWKAW
jgi:hypothetical protein